MEVILGNCKSTGLYQDQALSDKDSRIVITQILNRLIDNVVLTSNSSNIKQEICTETTNIKDSPCFEGRHVSLSPDEASGDLIIDSDLPSSAGPQETNEDSEQQTSPPRAEIDTSITSSITTENSRQRDSTQETSITEIYDDPLDENNKDIVALRNLEITPPPRATPELLESHDDNNIEQNQRAGKRKKTQPVTTTPKSSSEVTGSSGRSKRIRTQTKLFQAGDASLSTLNIEYLESSPEKPSSSKRPAKGTKQPAKNRRSTGPSPKPKPDQITALAPDNTFRTDTPQDVIFYERNDYLAIRNEENSYYLCQLMENVRSSQPMIRVKWLDTDDGGKTYRMTEQYDKIPHKSIILAVELHRLNLDRKGTQLFTLEDQTKDDIMERLKRSISMAPTQFGSSQETVADSS